MKEKRSLLFFIAYVYLRLRGERSRELNRLLFLLAVAPESRSSFAIKLKDSKLVASLDTPHLVAIARVAGNCRLSIEMNGIVSICCL